MNRRGFVQILGAGAASIGSLWRAIVTAVSGWFKAKAPNTITHSTGSFIQDGWIVGDTMEVPTEMLPAGWPESESEAETTQYRIVEITAEAMTIELLR